MDDPTTLFRAPEGDTGIGVPHETMPYAGPTGLDKCVAPFRGSASHSVGPQSQGLTPLDIHCRSLRGLSIVTPTTAIGHECKADDSPAFHKPRNSRLATVDQESPSLDVS
jgi:hypothetical protein